MQATAVAHSNIALSKYWGKRAGEGNRPAVPSLSLTLDGLTTRSSVRFDSSLGEDRLVLDGQRGAVEATRRVTLLLDRLWQRPGRPRAEVVSSNDFPTAAGLASSASAFAALAVAANAAARTGYGPDVLSDLARRSSASAARSLFGGFVELPAGGPEPAALLAARPLAPPEHWDLRLVVAVTALGPKAIGSTEGMARTAQTSPLYQAWLDGAVAIHERVRAAVLARDLPRLGEAAEQSALCMHAVAMASDPGLVYWNAATLEVMSAVRRLRDAGLAAYFTIDAGPHVKVITEAKDRAEVERRIQAVAGVLRTLNAKPGTGARLLVEPADGVGVSASRLPETTR
jgi:diphosphomevalonate decarboxylase